MLAFARKPRVTGVPSLDSELSYRIAVVDLEIFVHSPFGERISFLLPELQSVTIETHCREGEWLSLWWGFRGEKGRRCHFPCGVAGEERMLPLLQQLPGFDCTAILNALLNPQAGSFLCWAHAPVLADSIEKAEGGL